MKPSGSNESLHQPDHEIVSDRNFFGCFIPNINRQSSSDDVKKVS